MDLNLFVYKTKTTNPYKISKKETKRRSKVKYIECNYLDHNLYCFITMYIIYENNKKKMNKNLCINQKTSFATYDSKRKGYVRLGLQQSSVNLVSSCIFFYYFIFVVKLFIDLINKSSYKFGFSLN